MILLLQQFCEFEILPQVLNPLVQTLSSSFHYMIEIKLFEPNTSQVIDRNVN